MFEVVWENKDPQVAKIGIKKKKKTLPLRYKDKSQTIIIKTVNIGTRINRPKGHNREIIDRPMYTEYLIYNEGDTINQW